MEWWIDGWMNFLQLIAVIFAPKPSITIPNHRFPPSPEDLKICCSTDGEQKRAHAPPPYLWISHLKNILFSSMFISPPCTELHISPIFQYIGLTWNTSTNWTKLGWNHFYLFLTQLFPSYYSVLLLKVRNKWDLLCRLFNKPVCWQGAKILFGFKLIVLQYLSSDSQNTQNPAELFGTVCVLSS